MIENAVLSDKKTQFTKEDETIEGRMINSLMHLNWICLSNGIQRECKEGNQHLVLNADNFSDILKSFFQFRKFNKSKQKARWAVEGKGREREKEKKEEEEEVDGVGEGVGEEKKFKAAREKKQSNTKQSSD